MCVYFKTLDRTSEMFFKKAVDSVLSQTFSDFNFVIIDDGSDKKVIEFLASIKDERIQVHSKGNTGLTDSLNYGLQFCEEEYIVRQDADDLSEKTRFEKQIRLLEKFPKCGAAGCWYYYIDMNDVAYGSVCLNPMLIDTPRVAGTLAGGGCTLRRKAVLEAGGWKLKFAQDAYLWMRMRALGWELRNVPELLYSYRVHDNQISVKHRKKQREIAHSMAEIATL